LGNLSNLTCLSIVLNPFTGTVPTELGNLVNLETLSIGEGESYLEGPLPMSLINLDRIHYFTYGSGTNLCEPADPAFQEWLESIPELDGPRVTCPTEE
jgi:hypothetical protein